MHSTTRTFLGKSLFYRFNIVSNIFSFKLLGLGYILEIYGWECFMIFLMYGMVAIAAALIMPVITLNSTSKISSKQKVEWSIDLFCLWDFCELWTLLKLELIFALTANILASYLNNCVVFLLSCSGKLFSKKSNSKKIRDKLLTYTW